MAVAGLSPQLVLPADQPPVKGTFGSFEQHNCAICLGGLSRPVELACGHCFCASRALCRIPLSRICSAMSRRCDTDLYDRVVCVCVGYVCLVSASSNNHRCPLCRQQHILDPSALKSRRDSFREGYRAWRKGGANGARGEVGGVATLSDANAQYNLQNLSCTGKRSAADFIDGAGPTAMAARLDPPSKRYFCAEPGLTIKNKSNVHKSVADAKPQIEIPTEDTSAIAEVLAMMGGFDCNQPSPVSKRVTSKRRRKSTLAAKRQLTGIMYALCHAKLMPCIEAVEKSRLPQLGVLKPEERFALIVKFGREASSIKDILSVGITAVLNALPGSPERDPLKWDTLQRDILWKYQRRIQADSLYVYQEPTSTLSETIEQYGQAILHAIAPRSVDDVLREPLRRFATANPALTEGLSFLGPDAPIAVKSETAVGPEQSPSPVPTSSTIGPRQQTEQEPDGHERQLKVYACNLPGCDYTTVHRRYLDQHRRGHAGVKPFRCHWPGCTYACSGKGHLVRHIRVHTVRVKLLTACVNILYVRHGANSGSAALWRDRVKSLTSAPG